MVFSFGILGDGKKHRKYPLSKAFYTKLGLSIAMGRMVCKVGPQTKTEKKMEDKKRGVGSETTN